MVELALVTDTVTEQDIEQRATFDDFWLLYPRHVARRAAEKAWSRLTPQEQLAAVVAVFDWRRVWLKRGEVEYIPHASTWLNGARWEDELPEDAVTGPAHAAHVVAALPEQGAKAAMPEHVRAMIAKLRGAR